MRKEDIANVLAGLGLFITILVPRAEDSHVLEGPCEPCFHVDVISRVASTWVSFAEVAWVE
jgi:hypothetical protein